MMMMIYSEKRHYNEFQKLSLLHEGSFKNTER